MAKSKTNPKRRHKTAARRKQLKMEAMHKAYKQQRTKEAIFKHMQEDMEQKAKMQEEGPGMLDFVKEGVEVPLTENPIAEEIKELTIGDFPDEEE